MSPENYVERYLEDSKSKLKTEAFNDLKNALGHYLKFITGHGIDSFNADELIVDQFRSFLYRIECFDIGTLRTYIRVLDKFYDELKARTIVDKNPFKGKRCADLKAPLKDRYYTDEEIIKAFTENWKKLEYSPLFYPRYLSLLKGIQQWLKDHHKRLQTLKKDDLIQYGQYIESYRRANGAGLSYKGKHLYGQYMKWLCRWCYRNGYRSDDPTKGIHYTFTKEVIAPAQISLPAGWMSYKNKFILDMQGLWRPQTITNAHLSLNAFFKYLEESGIAEPIEINVDCLEAYKQHIYKEENLSESTKWQRLLQVRSFMKWLEKKDRILTNPSHKITWPKCPKKLPTRLMSAHEIRTLINAPDTTTPVGLRNRAIFELMYSTAVRVGEASSIQIDDIDFEQGLLKVQNPKGGPQYQRIVPIGQMALNWIKKYLDEARHQFPIGKGHERVLFLSRSGKPITLHTVNGAMHWYSVKLGMRKKYSSHSWRVSCATAMLVNHADIRHVQEQLGHRSLESTKIYTRLCPMDLKKIHTKTHPREREWRKLHLLHETGGQAEIRHQEVLETAS